MKIYQRLSKNGPKRSHASENRDQLKRKAWLQRYRRQNKAKRVEYNRKWRAENPDRALRAAVGRYGIDESDYRKMELGQNGRCAICKRLPSETDKRHRRLTVDHNHQTGKVRGLLCDRCNRMLGHALDSVTLLLQSIEYLRKY